MVSDTELVSRLHEVIRTSDLNTTTAGAIRRQLEEDFGVDLSDRKRFISHQIDKFLQCHMNQSRGEEGGYTAVNKKEENGEVEEEQEEEEQQEEQDEDEEESDDDRSSKIKSSDKEDSEKKRRGGGFTKLCSLSPQLQEFFGVPEMARTEVVKKLWAYIREEKLQDPENKRNIKCDKKLQAIFRVGCINMFQMNKALSKHIWPLETEDECSVNPPQKEKQHKRRKEEDVEAPKQKAKRQKGGASGFLAPLRLSDALTRFFGTGETALSRSEVVKRMWEYIKQNNLQDPSDKRRIVCDVKLKELFDVESFNGFSVTKLLTVHFIKTEQ
ncbi:hypothetical protein Nepgr_004555 [Nepenthes gracilis]|uniref:Uncharacterized protein n=1 Tax=Nepenthes gracilis TaxID=150966 RepID=A0AAD3XFJ0_NEPGR|nr:hypothetical protein Nepgr_004555 [Nepenthes gracilis]